ncbi:DNA-3-methyladenine glycosylase I [Burkholderia plantarii]|uniref:DNA-3-methyladenine glycosylase I n=1 Tax=Burkholderia plantarii TaxID=41899 RepID=UPI0018DBAFE9|nr:DNA-3-methyladenine glycosylase I [Burkholderia plantarii]MBI0330107.1 DNA-3-methyladenine glycosylase I [Burkholderia plantarii]
MEQDNPGLILDRHGVPRCYWQPDMPDYHDAEWGVPVDDEQRLFEKICLEGFQSGMAWITILRKRENFRAAFDGFDFRRIAEYGEPDIERLMADAGIVRNRAKIRSVINNARRAIEAVEEFGSLAGWLWQYEPKPGARPATIDLDYWKRNPTSTESHALSAAMKGRGWTFVGPTNIHALMQAVGMINDHLTGCACRETAELARERFRRPACR